MTDRTVVYRLVADVQQFRAGMASAQTSARQAGAELGGPVQSRANRASAAMSGLGVNAGMAAAALGGAIIVAAANFDKSMSGVQAATHETAANMDLLRNAAIEAGAATSFSATEAAAGIENLAKAGVSTQDILGGGLSGALDLAAAGQLGVADASEIAATALTQFKLSGEDVPHVADLLAAGAGKAQGEVSDLSMALKQSGLVASQMGISIEETTGTLAAFASAGLLGSDAGTSFRTMLLRLANPTKESAALMGDLGIQAYDAQGNFVGMASVAGQLQTAFEGKTQAERDSAMATLFGSDAIRAASVLFEQGAEGVEGWTNNVNDAGYAAETAAIQLDNLMGDVEGLKGALESAFITEGSDSQDMLRGVTQLSTDLVNLSTKASNADGALGTLYESAMRGLNPLGSLGGAYTQVKGAITGTDEASKDLDKSLEETPDKTEAVTRSMGGMSTSLENAEERAEDLKDMFKSLNAVLGARGDMRGYQDALDEMAKSIKDNGHSFDINTEKGRNNQGTLDDIATSALAVAENMNEASRAKFLTRAISDLRTMGENLGLPKSEVRALIQLLKEADTTRANPKIDPDTDGAINEIKAVRREIDGLNGKTIYIRTVRTESGKGPQPPASAFGNVFPAVTAFANGDIANGHQPVLAGPGPVRMWREPETQGEAYIPLANDARRPRARSILEQTATMLGGNVQWFAEGGVAGGKKATGIRDLDPNFEARAEARAEREHQARMDFLSGQERATSEWLDVAKVQEDTAKQTRDDLAATMASIGSGATAGFQSDLFATTPGDSNIWASGAKGPGGGWMDNLTGDIAGLEERRRLIEQLSAAGLDGDALGDALEQGSNEDLQSLLSSGQVQAFEDMFNQRAALTASVSMQAGQAAFGAEFAAANAQVAQYVAEVGKLQTMVVDLQRMQSPESPAAQRGYAVQGEMLAGAVKSGVVNGFQQVARRG